MGVPTRSTRVLREEDLIVREIRRLAEVVGRALQLESLSSRDEAEDVLGALHRAIFGLDRDLTLMLCPESLSILLAPQQRVEAITLLEQELRLLDGAGDRTAAAMRRAQLEALHRT